MGILYLFILIISFLSLISVIFFLIYHWGFQDAKNQFNHEITYMSSLTDTDDEELKNRFIDMLGHSLIQDLEITRREGIVVVRSNLFRKKK